MSLVNWLTSQPWPIFLPIWLGICAVFAAAPLAWVRWRRPRERKVSDWHMHECGCACQGHTIYPCDFHRGRARAVLHQEAP